MSNNSRHQLLMDLDLPREFEDLTGLVQADLVAIVNVLTERAQERLLLSPREARDLQARLWNRLTDTLNETMGPLSAEWR